MEQPSKGGGLRQYMSAEVEAAILVEQPSEAGGPRYCMRAKVGGGGEERRRREVGRREEEEQKDKIREPLIRVRE